MARGLGNVGGATVIRVAFAVVVAIALCLLSTISAAALVPSDDEPRPTPVAVALDLPRAFPPHSQVPALAHLMRTVWLRTLSTLPRARSAPTTPTTTRERAAPARRYATGVEQWRALVSQYPWPVDTMLAIMWCESKGDPNARNRSGASGLFQLLPGPSGWADPATNIRLAYETKYAPSGLSPWAASSGCW